LDINTVGANRGLAEGLSIYIEIFSPKKTGFPRKKHFSNFFLPLFSATVQCGRYNIFKKFELFFPMKT
jgi:hypothetical protein